MQAFCGAWLMGWYRLEWGPRLCSLPWWAGLPACWRPHPQTLGNEGPQGGCSRRGLVRVQWAGAEVQAPPFSLPASPALGISGYFRETIRQDIRQARERFSGPQLRQELARLQRRLDSVELLSPDIIMNLLLSYRDVQVRGAQRGSRAAGI